MIFIDWFFDILSYLGLYYKNARILFLGLDNAGKTTLLHILHDNRIAIHNPTQHPNVEELTIGRIRFTVLDVGGHETARALWKDYYTAVDGIVFVVDAKDPDRFFELKKELDALLLTDELIRVPFLILGNKIDDPSSVSEDVLKTTLGIHYITTGKDANTPNEIRPIELFMCSLIRRQGYKEGFQWLSKYLV